MESGLPVSRINLLVLSGNFFPSVFLFRLPFFFFVLLGLIRFTCLRSVFTGWKYEVASFAFRFWPFNEISSSSHDCLLWTTELSKL